MLGILAETENLSDLTTFLDADWPRGLCIRVSTNQNPGKMSDLTTFPSDMFMKCPPGLEIVLAPLLYRDNAGHFLNINFVLKTHIHI